MNVYSNYITFDGTKSILNASLSECQVPSKYNWPGLIRTASNMINKNIRARLTVSDTCSSICCQSNTIKNTGYHDLEPRILLIVFSYFENKDLVLIISRVCRHWHNVAWHPCLWKILEFTDQKIDPDIICTLLQRCTMLERLTLNNVQDPITIIRQMCRCSTRIKHLKIENCQIGSSEKIPECVLRNILYCCHNLESLDLEGTQFFAPRFFHELSNLPNLYKLHLGKNQYLCVDDLMTIALNCRSLQDIKVNCASSKVLSFQITDEDAIFFFNNLSKTLKCIDFDTMGLSTASFSAILSCSHLKKLSLHSAHFLTGNVLRENAPNLKNLKELRLRQACQLKSADLIFLGKKKILNNLTLLDISGCWKICDKGLKNVLDCCKDNLTYLGLKSCKSISNSNFIFTDCTKLQYLNIAYSFNPDEHHILKIPLQLPKLQKLVLDNNNISNGTLTELYKKMPNLKLMHSLSEFHEDEIPIYMAS